jgi:hypothetical protein
MGLCNVVHSLFLWLMANQLKTFTAAKWNFNWLQVTERRLK